MARYNHRPASWYIEEIARLKENIATAKQNLEDHESYCPGCNRTCNFRKGEITALRHELKRVAYAFQAVHPNGV